MNDLTFFEIVVLVIVGLCILLVIFMFLSFIVSGIMGAARKTSKTQLADDDEPLPVSATAALSLEPARGSAGEVKLYDVPDSRAAMIMAIAADKLGAPLNELKFISIREVEE